MVVVVIQTDGRGKCGKVHRICPEPICPTMIMRSGLIQPDVTLRFNIWLD